MFYNSSLLAMTVVLLTAGNAIAVDVSSIDKSNAENNSVVAKDISNADLSEILEIGSLENRSNILSDSRIISSVIDDTKEAAKTKLFPARIDNLNHSFTANYSGLTSLRSSNNEINSEIHTAQNPNVDSLIDNEIREVPLAFSAAPISTVSITSKIEPTSIDTTSLKEEYSAIYQSNNFVDPQNNGLTNRNPLTAQVPVPTEVTPANKRNYVGFTVGSVLNIPAYGVNAKFEVINNVSVRPFVQYAKLPRFPASIDGGTGNVDVSGFLYGLSATYDFNIPKSELAPYAGIGLAGASGTANTSDSTSPSATASTSPIYIELGADYNFTESIVLNLNYKFQDFGLLSFGAGYRF
jgi:opacity protein-like surface antigen